MWIKGRVILNLCNENNTRQAGADLGQAQHKLGLDFNEILCIFCFSIFDLVELVEWTLYFRLDLKDLVWYILVQCSLFFTFQTFCLVDLILVLEKGQAKAEIIIPNPVVF